MSDDGALDGYVDTDEEEEPSEEKKKATALLDTPVHRATINQLSVVELEAQLDELRERRLLARQKVEKAAKIKTEKADLTAYLKFEKQLKAAQKLLAKLDAEHAKLEVAVQKLRVLTVEMGVDD